MNKIKFWLMVREFPFLTKIVNMSEYPHKRVSADSVSHIGVKRGDRNLLEVTPCAWCHDADSMGEHSGYRSFWFITASGEVIEADSSWCRTLIPHGVRSQSSASPLGHQLASLKRDIEFIVEIHEEHWDYEYYEKALPNVIIYKVKGLQHSAAIDRAEKELYVSRGYPPALLD